MQSIDFLLCRAGRTLATSAVWDQVDYSLAGTSGPIGLRNGESW